MASGEATERSKGPGRPTPEQWEHIVEKHLTVHFNKERHLVEIGWAIGCGDKPCPVPYSTVAYYACPSRPCPPWTG